MLDNDFPRFDKRIIIFAGAYGSGKTEVAVNYAIRLALAGSQSPISIIDLDIVNPYFRSRQAKHEMETYGIDVITPLGEHCHADLPIVVPQIRGVIENGDGRVIIDVGGDDLGARVLGSLTDAFEKTPYEFLLVLNANRPFTADVAGSRRMISEIERSSRLKFTGIVSNTHLIGETTAEIVREGAKLARRVADASGLPLVFVTAMEEIARELGEQVEGGKVFALSRRMLKPWERPALNEG